MDYQEQIARYLSGDSTLQENKELLEWVNASEENTNIFLETSKIWYMSQKKSRRFDAVAAHEKFKHKVYSLMVKPPAVGDKKRVAGGKRVILYVASVAAMVALIIGAVFIQDNSPKQQTYSNATGTVAKRQLPDGSVLFLNKRAWVAVPVAFEGSTRTVEICGEAFFEVTPNAAKPFVVKTHHASITVVGTSFNVLVDSVEHNTKITVNTGKVLVESAHGASVELMPGQVAIVHERNGITKKANDDINYISWKTGSLVFNNTSLARVIHDVERHYDVKILLDTTACKDLFLNASFNKKPLDDVLKLIEITFAVRFEKQNSIFVLKK